MIVVSTMKLPLLLCLASLGVAAFATGCGPSYEEDEFEYGADEMRSAIVGDWSGDLTLTGRAPTTLTLHLEHQPPGVGPACGSQSLGVGLACSPHSSLGLKGTLSSTDGTYRDTPVEGSFWVNGVVLKSGSLSVYLDDGSELSAGWNQGSSELEGGTLQSDYRRLGTVTLRR